VKILSLTAGFPFPLDRGDRVRAYHFLRVLAARHEVTLLSFVARTEEERHRPSIEALGVRVRTILQPRERSLVKTALAATQRGRPFQVAYFDSTAMRAAVRAESTETDTVLAQMIRMAPYLDEVPAGVRRIVDLCNCVSSEYRASLPHRRGAEKLFYREEARRVAAAEREIAARVDEVWLSTSAEVGKIFGTRPPPNVVVVTNGVAVPEREPDPPRRTEAPRLIFTGNLRVPHNVDAVRLLATRIYPRILAELPQATLHFAGADPAPRVTALAGPGITVHGFLPDLYEFLRTGDVFVAPIRFVAGVQNKVLEALAVGLPVVTTPLVNRGLGAKSGTHLLLASDPIETADAVLRIVNDPTLARELSREGRRLVRERFRWESVLERFEGIDAPASKPRGS
jgi:sugar transferase (PEP-CTERM/EpsH1 system associated)